VLFQYWCARELWQWLVSETDTILSVRCRRRRLSISREVFGGFADQCRTTMFDMLRTRWSLLSRRFSGVRVWDLSVLDSSAMFSLHNHAGGSYLPHGAVCTLRRALRRQLFRSLSWVTLSRVALLWTVHLQDIGLPYILFQHEDLCCS